MTKKKGLIKIILFVLAAVLCWSTFAGLFHTKPQQGSNNTNTQQTNDVPDNPPEEPELIIDPVLENNSWETIKAAFRAGVASDYWQVGDTKTVDINDGYTYTVRIADMTEGRYAYSDGSGYSNNVFEFVECMNTTRQMNSVSTNTGGYAECSLRSELNTVVFELFPDELQTVISEVVIETTIGGGSIDTSESSNLIFLASEEEIFGTTTLSKGALSPFDYYRTHNSDNFRVKQLVTSSSPISWWLRDPMKVGIPWVIANSSGVDSSMRATEYLGVCPFFCL